jgi:hypothetical protein
MKRRLLIAVAIVVLFFAFGLRLTHPNEGLTSAMGSAQSGIVIYKHSDKYSKGDKVVFRLKESASPDNVYLGQVITSDANGVGIDAKAVITQINPADVKGAIKGKMIVIVPFFGKIFDLIGL